MKKVHLWRALLIIGLVVIIFMGAKYMRVVVQKTGVTATVSPLELALENDVPDAEFEELVRKHPKWTSYKPNDSGSFNWPILAHCALLERTNYVRILIANGADAEQAVESLKEVGASEAIALIEQLQRQSPSKETRQ
jgi:hypothetical protein